MVSDRAFIVHIYIPLGKALSLVPKSRSSVKVMVKHQGHSFRKKLELCFTNTACFDLSSYDDLLGMMHHKEELSPLLPEDGSHML